jgi:pyruvate kinase
MFGLERLFSRGKKSVSAPAVSTGKRPVNLQVTLWPAFPHFRRFAHDNRVQGIRLNSAMMEASEIDGKFMMAAKASEVPLWFDVKGMQMRIREVIPSNDHLEFVLNRPVKVKTPCTVWFKGGEDRGRVREIVNGTRFIFDGGPEFNVKAGESIHILEDDLEVGGDTFLPYEIEKIEKVKAAGIKRWYLSYVYAQRHVDEFRELIGDDAELYLKIENVAGLKYVADEYKPMPKTNLVMARGDMFVEIPRPHEILKASKFLIEKDPDAVVGSRMLLSLVEKPDERTGKKKYLPVPSAADLSELAWLHDIGFKNFLLCDELCLKEHMLAAAVNVFDAFRTDYCGL